MPTYEYECKKCLHRLEKLQSIKAKSLRKCPKCGHLALERLISAGSGLIFKGSGFYITDYCRPKRNEKNESKSNIENKAKKDNNKK